ncbi:redoxin domain-containing protein [Lutimonas saemankumensis]|uniref:thioredoxin-like domain-containing protein n=1 Tax=Lutimonas saemankumensis TaxID=483016 RepID=UPI001CD447A9|nr:thioredoxin-like domain-containing protein [Lutimonas saemankumensis]MCA0933145.1 redoxin domain-containing protein [Lutimonas saemankumensis]
MKTYLLVILLAASSYVQAQYSIKGTIDPDHDYSWILLYQMQNGEQSYVDNADVIDGQFTFNVDENQSPGVYRAYYQIENDLYVEFIYNQEEIEFSFDPNNPESTIYFLESAENKIYRSYYKNIRAIQEKLDSVQVLFFESGDKKEKKTLKKSYTSILEELTAIQKDYEARSSELLANHFIRASAQHNAAEPIENPQEYLNMIKMHFFDAMDLSDEVLSHSTFIYNRLNDYVFYLNQAETLERQNELQKDAIEKAVLWMDQYDEIKMEFEEELLETYLEQENVEMINHVLNEYYLKLPEESLNKEMISRINASIKTMIGVRAPDFSWSENGVETSLYELSGTDYYVVLFFSSNCPHCQIEIPEFYKFISGIENIKVVAVGLEDEKRSWEIMTKGYDEFINILDLDKWSSQKVENYGITAIPTYLVLDSNKNILAKPEDFNELKSMFETR